MSSFIMMFPPFNQHLIIMEKWRMVISCCSDSHRVPQGLDRSSEAMYPVKIASARVGFIYLVKDLGQNHYGQRGLQAHAFLQDSSKDEVPLHGVGDCVR